MRILFFNILLVLVLSFSACEQKNQESVIDKMTRDSLVSMEDKISYVEGYNLSKDYTNIRFKMNYEAIARGARDAQLNPNGAFFTQQEMDRISFEFDSTVRKRQQDDFDRLKELNTRKGEEFREKMKSRDNVVSLPSGLMYEVIEKGTGKVPTFDDSVSLQYRGTYLNGSIFDDYNGEVAGVRVNDGLIDGWKEALLLMEKGSKWKIYLPPSLAFGESHVNEVVQPNATVVYEIELLDIIK